MSVVTGLRSFLSITAKGNAKNKPSHTRYDWVLSLPNRITYLNHSGSGIPDLPPLVARISKALCPA